jgi:hypothetical protein
VAVVGRRTSLAAAALGLALALAAGWAALAPLPPMPRERVYVIPKGTGARQAAGQRVSPLPSRIRLLLGVQDVLVLRNEDEVPQSFGPIQLRPRQTYRVPFQVAATFDFACSVHENGQVAVVVQRPPAAGWERLGWRLMTTAEWVRRAVAREVTA